MYYNTNPAVNNKFCTDIPRLIVYRSGLGNVCEPFAYGSGEAAINEGWQHVLALTFEGMRADRVRNSIVISRWWSGKFMGGFA